MTRGPKRINDMKAPLFERGYTRAVRALKAGKIVKLGPAISALAAKYQVSVSTFYLILGKYRRK